MSKIKLISFTGKMGSGKTTAIAYLKELSTYKVIPVKFAQPIYDIQSFIYDRVSAVHTPDSSFTKDRKLLQYLGVEWGRNSIKPTLWVDLWQNTVLKLHEHNAYGVFACDDVRFDDEAKMVKNLGGFVIEIVSNHPKPEGTEGFNGHESEKGVSINLIDYTIKNNGSIEDFKSSLNTVFRRTGIL